MMVPDRSSGLLAFSAISVYEIGFDELGLDRAEFDIRCENVEVIRFHLKSGAEEIGEVEGIRRFVFHRWKFPAFKDANMNRLKMHRRFYS